MIKNLEIEILKIDWEIRNTGIGPIMAEAEDFNWDFAAIGYFYFLKLKKIKIPDCSYIKIKIKNTIAIRDLNFNVAAKVLYVNYNYDFGKYISLSKKEKEKFQYGLIKYILKETFAHFNLDDDILNNVQEELTTNNWEMKAVAFSKKIRKQYIFNLVLHLQIDSFTFIGEVIENDIKYEILILNSRPSYFVMYYLFGGYKIENNLIIIGNKKQRIFNIDLESKSISIQVNAKKIISEWSIKK